MPTNELTRTLEDLVDANSLYDVLQALADIASEKEQHLAHSGASRWHKAAHIVQKAADKIGDL